MEEGTRPWHVRLLLNFSFTLIGFLIVNFYYANELYDLKSFLEDYPSFPYSYFPAIIIPIFFPIIFFIPVLLVERFGKTENRTWEICLTLLGQIIISAVFFYGLWHLMVNASGYPTLIDQEQATKGFLYFCISAFLTVGIFASHDLRELIEYTIDKLLKLTPKR
jgi:hypothetical protein